MAGKNKIIITLHPTTYTAEGAVYNVMLTTLGEAHRQGVQMVWHEEPADPA